MPFTCVVGGTVATRTAAARERSGEHLSGDHGEEHGFRRAQEIPLVPPAQWPFVRHILPSPAPDHPVTLRLHSLDLAFPSGQASGTRLVLTQSTYQLQRCLDWLASAPLATIVADASREGLRAGAPEALSGRGPWARIELVLLEGDEPSPADSSEEHRSLREVFTAATPAARLARVERASAGDPDNAALLLAVASVSMELEDAPRAQAALDRALILAEDWEAVWFEYGKLWLRADDLERAADQFAEAARLMPTFAGALSNLGAALAETERPQEAIQALEAALRHEPSAHTVLNNLAVVYREQGRLDDAVAASRRVLGLAPEFTFGHYNLGHALFLQGRFAEARNAYVEGQRRDAQRNPVQASRAAVARAAAGEYDRAVSEMSALAAMLPDAAREQVFGEAEATLEALSGLPGADRKGLSRVLDVVRAALKQR
jgi:tetratricopeptide (TPR) repeat protein